MKRLFALILVFVLPFTAFATGYTKQESYNNALDLLYDFDAESLETALRFFEDAGSYKDASLFKIYAEALYDLSRTDGDAAALSNAELCIKTLIDDAEFAQTLSDYGYASCKDLATYIEARKAERRGDSLTAIEKYGTIRRVLDSIDRQKRLMAGDAQQNYDEALSLYNEGKYWEAGLIFKDLNWLDSEEKYADCVRLHEHEFSPATCEAPSVCEVCGEILGEALGHDYAEATCETPATCTRCDKTDGAALGHDFKGGDCVTPAVCTRCGAKSEAVGAHTWMTATCETPKTCSVCGATEGKALGHNWQSATYEAPETCSRCGETRGEKLKPQNKVGDIYIFGAYEQDNNLSSKEAIEWIIIDVADNGALTLMSKYALDCKKYNDTQTSVTWETCTLRKWLNEDFYNAAFNADEQSRIVPVTLENEDNPYYGTKGGNDTQDKVWLLSINEVTNYFTADKVYSFFTEDSMRVCYPTAYAEAQGAYTYSGACWWWLRSPGNYSRDAAYVRIVGIVSYRGDYVYRDDDCVRPVVVALP